MRAMRARSELEAELYEQPSDASLASLGRMFFRRVHFNAVDLQLPQLPNLSSVTTRAMKGTDDEMMYIDAEAGPRGKLALHAYLLNKK